MAGRYIVMAIYILVCLGFVFLANFAARHGFISMAESKVARRTVLFAIALLVACYLLWLVA